MLLIVNSNRRESLLTFVLQFEAIMEKKRKTLLQILKGHFSQNQAIANVIEIEGDEWESNVELDLCGFEHKILLYFR